MSILDWLYDFLESHRARLQPHDWPNPDSEEYREYVQDWYEAFDGPGVTQDEATRASRRLARVNPPRWKREHLPGIVETIRTMRAERATPADAVNSMDSARMASANCEHCGGQGLVTVWHPAPDPERRIAPTAAAHCICPAGRYMRKRFAHEDAQVLRRIPDYADVLTGRSGWLDADPTVEAVEGDARAALAGRKAGPSFAGPVSRQGLKAIGKPTLPDRILTPEAAAAAAELDGPIPTTGGEG